MQANKGDHGSAGFETGFSSALGFAESCDKHAYRGDLVIPSLNIVTVLPDRISPGPGYGCYLQTR